jgi:hypothetical protein
MANAPDRPQIDIMAGDVGVVVTGREDDDPDDLREVALDTFGDVVEEYIENRDGEARF